MRTLRLSESTERISRLQRESQIKVLAVFAERVLTPFLLEFPADIRELSERTLGQIWASDEVDREAMKVIWEEWTARDYIASADGGLFGPRQYAISSLSELAQAIAGGYELPVLVGYSEGALTSVVGRLVMVEDGLAGEQGTIMTPERVKRRNHLIESLPEIQTEVAYRNDVVDFVASRENAGRPFTKAEVHAECWKGPPIFDNLVRSAD